MLKNSFNSNYLLNSSLNIQFIHKSSRIKWEVGSRTRLISDIKLDIIYPRY